MAWVFVRLKLALLRGGFSTSRASLVLYTIGTVVSIALGIAVGALLTGLFSKGTVTGAAFTLVLFTLVWLMWIVGPMLNSSQGDQTLDPSRLELLPLTRGQQVRGPLIAGLVSPAALGTLIGALGPALGSAMSTAARLGAIVVAVLFVLGCVAWSRALAAVFTGALNTRRGRDLTVAVSGIVGVGVYLISQRLAADTGSLIDSRSSGAYQVLVVLPPAALGESLERMRNGDWLVALALLGWGLVGILGALLLWNWALARRLDGGGGTRRSSQLTGPVGDSVLYQPVVDWLPRDAFGATAAKEMRYYLFRSTLQLQQLVLGIVFALIFVGREVFDDRSGPQSDYIGALVLFIVLFQSAPNVFGIDNSAVSVYLLSGVKMSSVLFGKLLALLLIGLPLGIVLQLIATGLHGDWSRLPLGLAVLPVPWLVWLGLGSQISVRGAFPVRPGRKSASGIALAATFGGLVVGLLILAVLLGAAIVVGRAAGSPWAGIVVVWLLGLAIGYFGMRDAGRRLDRDPTALLIKLGGDRA